MSTARTFGLVVLITAFIAACGNSVSDRAARDEVTHVEKDDPAMLKAFDKARQTLPAFLEQAENPSSKSTEFAIKVRMSRGDDVEYFWVTPFTRSGSEFTGTLANDGALLTQYQAGQNVNFSELDVVDWLYHDAATGVMHGNFTACALLTHEDPKEAAEFKKEYGLECSDP